jgi:hypothetical protein
MPDDATPARRTSIFVIRASAEADGQFLARITAISDWMADSATPRTVPDPKDIADAVQTWLRVAASGEAGSPPGSDLARPAQSVTHPRSSGPRAAWLGLTKFARIVPPPPDRLLVAVAAQAGSLTSDPCIGAGAYGPSTEIRTRTNMPL